MWGSVKDNEGEQAEQDEVKETGDKQPAHVTVTNCVFNGGSGNPDIVALAEAVKANAEAIKEVAKHAGSPAQDALLKVGSV